jgi:hypothetical protein
MVIPVDRLPLTWSEEVSGIVELVFATAMLIWSAPSPWLKMEGVLLNACEALAAVTGVPPLA